MSSKVKRKVTVENSKENADQPRRPSVFERLGPGALNLSSQSQDRHSRIDQHEKCRNWLRTGNCAYGSTCRYQHDPYPSNSKRSQKAEKEMDEKDLRHKMRKQRDDPKESRTGSVSPKRKGTKRGGSRSRKGEHEGKIKSTVVVTRLRSPAVPTSGPQAAEPTEEKKKKADGSWEDDSDDWPMDAAQLDYKEELTLERKRQQLQRELELELQKERMMNENVTITKTVSFSESSSTSSSSDSGSISSSSDSSSSSSDEDSDDSSSSSSSSSSSTSQAPVKKKYKKPVSKKEPASSKKAEPPIRKKPLDDYDKIKSSRAAKAASSRVISPLSPETPRKGRDHRVTPSPASSPKRRGAADLSVKGSTRTVHKGPRTPSPPPSSQKRRLWGQSSSADSRGADSRRNKGKRHKKKKELSRTEHRYDHVLVPPRLSTPNRTMLHPHGQVSKKTWKKDDAKSHRSRDQSPTLTSRLPGLSNSPGNRYGNGGYHKDANKHNKKPLGKKSVESASRSRRSTSRDRSSKNPRFSPARDSRHGSVSPHRDRFESENLPRKMYSSPLVPSEKSDKSRRRSLSPLRHGNDGKDRKKMFPESEKRRDASPRSHDNRREAQFRSSELHGYGKKDEPKVKRLLSPDVKKGRDDKTKDRGTKERNVDHESWSEDHKKISSRQPESRSRLEPPPPSQLSSRNERPRDRERDRKKGKEGELILRLREDIERDRQRLTPPLRKSTDVHAHHGIRDEAPIPVARGHVYEAELPPVERDYAYGYGSRHEPAYIDERALPPDYDPDLLRGVPLYPPPESADYPHPVYSDPLYRRGVTLKEPVHIERIPGYVGRDISPLDPRDALPREEDFLNLTMEEARAFEERWGRNKPLRDEWDPYGTLPPPPPLPPPHVAAAVSEDRDRYGMPRRRRASPDWHIHRGDDREMPVRERRSRSPPHRRDDVPPPNRGSWRDDRPQDRHGNRSNETRSDSQQKGQVDDRKGRNNLRRDRRGDRGKKPDEPPNEPKPPPSKEKIAGKRTRSPSPVKKDLKKKREETASTTTTTTTTSISEKACVLMEDALSRYLKGRAASSRKFREDTKQESKTPANNRKTPKADLPASPKVDVTAKPSEKHEQPETPAAKNPPKPETEEKRRRNNGDKGNADDDFSDWSDGDDDLLNRDFNDSETNNGEKAQSKGESHKKDKEKDKQPTEATDGDGKERSASKESSSSRKKRDGSRDSRVRTHELKSDSRNRPRSKERFATESSAAGKLDVVVQSSKESESSEPYVVKDEAVGEPDDFVTTESVDYDPISDDELEAMIEDPNDALMKASDESTDAKIVDALDVDWSTLMNDPKPAFVPGKARKRFKTAHVLSRIGFSQTLAGAALTEKLLKFCQQQLDEEKSEESISTDNTFQMEHRIAAFHVSLAERKKERQKLFQQVGPARRALCARQDLHIRKLLCRPSNKLILPGSCVQQYGSTEPAGQKDIESQPPVVNAAC